MDKRPAAAAESLRRRNAQRELDFVPALASQPPVPGQPAQLRAPRVAVHARACASLGDYSGEGSLGIAIPPSWAIRHSPDADLDAEILAWIASHVTATSH